jgi:type IV secretion system protein TrbL
VSCSVNPLSWGGCVTGAIGHVLGGAGKAVAGGVFDAIAHAFGDAAQAAVNWLWKQVSSATAIDLSGPGIRNLLAITAAIAAIIAVAMFCIQVIACALRQDFGGLGRAVRGMLVAFVGAAFAIAATQILLGAVDELSNGVVQAATGQDVTGVGKKLVLASALGGLNSAGLFLFAIVLLISVVVIWCALMIRKMLIIVAAVFAPIAFSGSTSDLTKGWVRKWIEFTVALICSKLILVLIFMIGLSMVNGAGSTGGASNAVTNLAIGSLTLLLAGFAPWLAIKMVHFTGDAFHHVHAQAGAARAGAVAVVAAPQKASAMHSQAASLQSKFSGNGQSGAQGGNPAKPEQSNTGARGGQPAAAGSAQGAAVGPAAAAVGAAQVAKGAKDKAFGSVQQGQDVGTRAQGSDSSSQPTKAPTGRSYPAAPPPPELRPPRAK